MFKRIEKRLKRKKLEDELGLDEETKELFGINDTDSDESDSDSDSNPSSGEEDADAPLDDEDEDDTLLDDEEEHSDDEAPERTLITIEEALTNPIYILSLDPDIRECIICPGKRLKGPRMTEVHKSSNAHERRFKRFKTQAASSDPKAKAHVLIKDTMNDSSITTSQELSNRAQKRSIAKEKRKTKREKFKARQKKKAALIGVAKDSFIKSNEERKEEEEGAPAIKKQGKVEKATKDNIRAKEKRAQEMTSRQPPTGGKRQDAKQLEKRKATETQGSPQKKRKTLDPSTPPTRLVKTKPPPLLKDTEPAESSEEIQELQAQVKNIIQSASSLAKAARAHALSGKETSSLARRQKTTKPSKS